MRLVPIETRRRRVLTYPGEHRVMAEALAWVRAAGYGGAGAKEGPDAVDR